MKKTMIWTLIAMMTLAGCGSAAGSGTESTESTKSPANETSAEAGTEGESSGVVDSVDGVVSQEGPYGTIYLTVNDRWNVTGHSTTDSRVGNVYYGLELDSKNHDSGMIEVGYCPNFGVCGTSLNEETTTLAGEEAIFGKYDGSKFWDFIIWHGEREGIIAVANDVDSWSGQEMEDIREILDTLVYKPEEASGVMDVYEPESENEEFGVAASLRLYSTSSGELVLERWNDDPNSLTYGEAYTIEVKDGDTWKEAEIVADGEYGFTDIGYILEAGDVALRELNWEAIYGQLPAGDYRMVITMYGPDGQGGTKPVTLYPHFIVR